MFALTVEWTEPPLPKLVGPFKSEVDADMWASQRVRDGEWEIVPLAAPTPLPNWPDK